MDFLTQIQDLVSQVFDWIMQLIQSILGGLGG